MREAEGTDRPSGFEGGPPTFSRHAISDADRDRVKHLLPGQPGQHSGVARDDRSKAEQYRRAATRYDKKAANFLASVKVAALVVMLK